MPKSCVSPQAKLKKSQNWHKIMRFRFGNVRLLSSNMRASLIAKLR